jgi:hypothetical protein
VRALRSEVAELANVCVELFLEHVELNGLAQLIARVLDSELNVDLRVDVVGACK